MLIALMSRIVIITTDFNDIVPQLLSEAITIAFHIRGLPIAGIRYQNGHQAVMRRKTRMSAPPLYDVQLSASLLIGEVLQPPDSLCRGF
jgi:hypothetical protein